jgi:CRISPR/Cas system-associated endonuclease/helicase Cas3
MDTRPKISTQGLIQWLLRDGVEKEKALESVRRFVSFHKKNPNVWKFFSAISLKFIEMGEKRGYKFIVEIARYESFKQNQTSFKINNSYSSLYARMFALKYPEHKDYFNFRKLKGLKDKDEAETQPEQARLI